MASDEQAKALSDSRSQGEAEHQAAAEAGKQAAAQAAAMHVQAGMAVGLGTGSTVARFLPALVARGLDGLRCVATSPATEQAALKLGLQVVTLSELDGTLDIAIDGADEVDPHGWVIKGGGGAHTREKVIAAAAEEFIVIVDASKLVNELKGPVPLEVLPFATALALKALAPAKLRAAPPTPDGNVLIDYLGKIEDKRELAERLARTPGVVEHGIFPRSLISEVIVGERDDARTLAFVSS